MANLTPEQEREIDGWTDKEVPSIYWNLDQTMAWVFWRDDGIVHALRKTKEPYLALAYHLETPGWKPLTRKGVEIPLVAMPSDLMTQLRAGTINARGSPQGKGDRQIITAEMWEELWIQAPQFSHSFASSTANGGREWHDVLFLTADVRKQFPPIGIIAPEPRSSAAKRTLQQLVDAEVQDFLERTKPEVVHGWKARVASELKKRPILRECNLETILKYSRLRLTDYENTGKEKSIRD